MTLDQRSHISALAKTLRVSQTDLVGGPHLTADPGAGGARVQWTRIVTDRRLFSGPTWGSRVLFEEAQQEALT
jgi:hypothetical protein